MNKKNLVDKLDQSIKIILKIKLKLEKKKNRDIKLELDKNLQFENKHKNQRCFILGNGPSLAKQELYLLKNEKTFTVNQINKSDVFNTINTDYHVIVDPIFFNIDKNNKEDYERYLTMKKLVDTDIPIFVPYEHKESLIKNELLKDNVRFIKIGPMLIDNNEKIDMNNLLPGAFTVVQIAIHIAIYMGFKDIYILGCDCTGIIQQLQLEQDGDIEKYGHIYKYSEQEKKHIKKNIQKHTNEDLLETHTNVFKGYRMLKLLSGKQKFNIINLTVGGSLDVFERSTIEAVLKEKTIGKQE